MAEPTQAAAGPQALEGVVLEALGEAFIATRPDGTVTAWNRAAERMYGWTAAEVLGRNIMDVTPTGLARRGRTGHGSPDPGAVLVR